MRRLERMRNEAIRHHDRSADIDIRLKAREINRTFWGAKRLELDSGRQHGLAPRSWPYRPQPD